MLGGSLMSKPMPVIVVLALTLLGTGSVWSQSVISAHSGVIHYLEGRVTVDGQIVQPKFAEFPDVKEDQKLSTEDGRAEVLLTPGVFLRLAENSSFRMISNRLPDTRVEIIDGSAVVEVAELLPDNAITLLFRGTQVVLLKKGIYRVDADGDNPVLRVYGGEARVTPDAATTPNLQSGLSNTPTNSTKPVVVKQGHQIELSSLTQGTFDAKATDAFYRWNSRRSEYIAEANVSAAKSAHDGGMAYTASGNTGGNWAWNPWFGSFTYLPATGTYFSPFGWTYFSPLSVNSFYLAQPVGFAGFPGRLSPGAVTAAPRYAGAPVGSPIGGGASRASIPSGSIGGLRGAPMGGHAGRASSH